MRNKRGEEGEGRKREEGRRKKNRISGEPGMYTIGGNPQNTTEMQNVAKNNIFIPASLIT